MGASDCDFAVFPTNPERALALCRIGYRRETHFTARSLPTHEVENHVFTNSGKIINVAGDEVSADAPRRQRD
jgi:hypothetical protein